MMAELAPVRTPISKPEDHRAFILGLDGILRENLPPELNLPHVRARLIAHSSLAVGWNTDPQRCWHYNAFGVRRGSWKGDYYLRPALEVINGKEVQLPAAKSPWRAYKSWKEAVSDLVRLLSSERYSPALPMLINPHSNDGEYWERMGELGWYTAPPAEAGEAFASRARAAREVLGLPLENGSADWQTIALCGLAVAALAMIVWLVVR